MIFGEKSCVVLIAIVLLVSCGSSYKKKKDFNKMDVTFIKTDSLKYLDLSNKNLSEFPNLSEFYIENLNLSNNDLSDVKVAFFPRGLSKLNVSHNDLSGTINLLKELNLNILDLSYNKLDSLVIGQCINNINLSNNNLTLLYIVCNDSNSLDSLNISQNKKLDSELRFNPKLFRTIIRDSILNKKPLIWSLNVPIKD